MVCRRPKIVSYPYVICKECYETSRAVDYVHALQVRYERLARAARDVVSQMLTLADIDNNKSAKALADALRECEQV